MVNACLLPDSSAPSLPQYLGKAETCRTMPLLILSLFFPPDFVPRRTPFAFDTDLQLTFAASPLLWDVLALAAQVCKGLLLSFMR